MQGLAEKDEQDIHPGAVLLHTSMQAARPPQREWNNTGVRPSDVVDPIDMAVVLVHSKLASCANPAPFKNPCTRALQSSKEAPLRFAIAHGPRVNHVFQRARKTTHMCGHSPFRCIKPLRLGLAFAPRESPSTFSLTCSHESHLL